MVVRIFRGWMKPEDEKGIYQDFRTAMASGARPAGMLDMIFARNVGSDGRVELITISMWTDMAAVVVGLGPDWQRPFGLKGFENRISDTTLEHLEVIADDWPELMALFAGERVMRLS